MQLNDANQTNSDLTESVTHLKYKVKASEPDLNKQRAKVRKPGDAPAAFQGASTGMNVSYHWGPEIEKHHSSQKTIHRHRWATADGCLKSRHENIGGRKTQEIVPWGGGGEHAGSGEPTKSSNKKTKAWNLTLTNVWLVFLSIEVAVNDVIDLTFVFKYFIYKKCKVTVFWEGFYR